MYEPLRAGILQVCLKRSSSRTPIEQGVFWKPHSYDKLLLDVELKKRETVLSILGRISSARASTDTKVHALMALNYHRSAVERFRREGGRGDANYMR